MPVNANTLQNLHGSPFVQICKSKPWVCHSLQNLDDLQNLRVKDGRVHTIQGAKIQHISDALKKAKKNTLQNLAWLDADGNVHTVQQPNDGSRLLGATYPEQQYLI